MAGRTTTRPSDAALFEPSGFAPQSIPPSAPNGSPKPRRAWWAALLALVGFGLLGVLAASASQTSSAELHAHALPLSALLARAAKKASAASAQSSGDWGEPAIPSRPKHLVLLFHATEVVRPIYQRALSARVEGAQLHIVNSPFGVFANGYRHLMEHLRVQHRTSYLDAVAQYARTEPLARYDTITVASFSAGYAAVRAMLEEPESAELIDGVVAIDSWHAEFDPDGTARDSQLDGLARFAELAAQGPRLCWIRHTDVEVPKRGGRRFASTTEVATELRRLTGLPARGDDVSRGGLRVSAVNLQRHHHLEHTVALWGWGDDWLADGVASLIERRAALAGRSE